MPLPFPLQGRLAGIDYGHVRIGIAVCDPDRTFASPLTTYTRRTPDLDAEYFRRLADEQRLVGFVVGLPVLATGQESAKSLEARRFGDWLNRSTGMPIRYFDERYTTVEATDVLSRHEMRGKRRKQRIDMLAAQILLTAFLEAPRSADRPAQPLDGDARPAT